MSCLHRHNLIQQGRGDPRVNSSVSFLKPGALLFLLALFPSGTLHSQVPTALSVPDTSIVLDQVSVMAYHSFQRLQLVPGSVSVLTGNAVSPSDGIQMMHTLNLLPGVNMQSGTPGTGRITIRGMGSRTPYNTNRIRAYLNDIPLTGSDGISAPEDIDLPSLGRIEIIRGPSSALYGSGLGGSINMYTPSAVSDKGQAFAQYGSFRTAFLHFSGLTGGENGGLRLSLNHLQNNGFRENSRYQRTSLLSTFNRSLSGWSVNGTLLVSGIRSQIPSSLGKTMFEDNPSAAAPNWKAVSGYQQTFKALAGITLSGRLAANTMNHFTLFGKWNDDFERRPFNDLDDRSASVGFRNKIMIHRSFSDWIIGTEWLADSYSWKLIKAGALLNENREIRTHYGMYVVSYFRPLPELILSAAAAVNQTLYRLTDLFPANGEQSAKRKFPLIVSPRVGFSYAPADNTLLYGSAGHGYSLPSPEETLLPEGEVNPEIKPEQGWQMEAGLRQNLFGSSLWMDATVYVIALRNLLITQRITEDIFTGINAGKTRHSGLELMIGNHFFRYGKFPGNLSSVLTFTGSVNRFIDFTDGISRYDGKKLPGIPSPSLHCRIDWKPWNPVDWLLHLSHTGSQYLDDGNRGKSAGYFLMNSKITVQILTPGSGAISLYAGVNNLTGSHYASMVVVNAIAPPGAEPRYYYPGTPRHGFAGIRYTF